MDYEKFDSYCDKGIFFASRLKKNSIVRELIAFQVPEKSTILSDSMVVIGTTQKRTENVFRLIETTDSEENPVQIITNRFDLEAEEPGELYRSRWAIELFFKWMKQHLRIKHLYGTSEESVLNQVFITMITYCLLILIQLEFRSKHTLLQIIGWLRVLLWKSSKEWTSKLKLFPD